MFKTTLTDRLT